MTNLFGHSIPSSLLSLFALEAAASLGAFYLILLWGIPEGAALSHLQLLSIAALFTACASLAGGATGLYSPRCWLRANRVAASAVLAGIAFVVVGEFLFPEMSAASGAALPMLAQAGFVGAFVAAVVSSRLLFAAAARRGMLNGRVVLVGSDPTPMPQRLPPEVATVLHAGASLDAELAPERLRSLRASTVVVRDPGELAVTTRVRLAAANVRVMSEAEWLECCSAEVDIASLPTGWLAGLDQRQEGVLEAGVRRALDVTLSLALLLFTLPILILTAIAIKLDSPGPVFYRQDRVGRDGRTFTLFKFRSMRQDAEVAGAPIWAQKGDAWVTRTGRFLRLTRIDEIPQVFNVLLGHMAFVGPRPERPGFVEDLARQIPHYEARHVVKPGITGWAQVNYPYGASVEDARRKLAFDLYYVKRRSLFLDLLIIISTVRVVLFQEGSR
ncbi:exopolysaccharide biosynthesis polyprenyl glycosylphosphotransferase [Sabulicella glaciei]|uniref:Exopolysaccharide biosynthesis polyprenyl glycosylphosphotransferase n=1 Tax=Sabulicella glaciei TaxID=2984948 RepID=A0ABT3NRL2_9PROT|nr:exopolysaccharide biosynthesis polyprenyl glycosylphosphotransferase [Roseococcus sp. MDT2-1-1]MCW8084806.1 exopolysaccharide biosynthesis polyprenyl glycosylphosphotransferase [Roseococcus sp. MDT2-1-1]